MHNDLVDDGGLRVAVLTRGHGESFAIMLPPISVLGFEKASQPIGGCDTLAHMWIAGNGGGELALGTRQTLLSAAKWLMLGLMLPSSTFAVLAFACLVDMEFIVRNRPTTRSGLGLVMLFPLGS